ncbi:MAG: hypothetical protein JWO38_7422 [Gemmataceae bacterium]|nr:hypothetical protein [Gemmataceae bacterium]
MTAGEVGPDCPRRTRGNDHIMTRTPPKTAAGRGVRRASGRAAWVETVGGFRDRSGPPCSQGEHPNALGLPNPAIPCHRPVTRSSPTARRSTTGPAQLALPGSRFCGSKPIDTVSSHGWGPDQLGKSFLPTEANRPRSFRLRGPGSIGGAGRFCGPKPIRSAAANVASPTPSSTRTTRNRAVQTRNRSPRGCQTLPESATDRLHENSTSPGGSQTLPIPVICCHQLVVDGTGRTPGTRPAKTCQYLPLTTTTRTAGGMSKTRPVRTETLFTSDLSPHSGRRLEGDFSRRGLRKCENCQTNPIGINPSHSAGEGPDPR